MATLTNNMNNNGEGKTFTENRQSAHSYSMKITADEIRKRDDIRLLSPIAYTVYSVESL
jgi:hypothetical protein